MDGFSDRFAWAYLSAHYEPVDIIVITSNVPCHWHNLVHY
jgi:hypothetical protein